MFFIECDIDDKIIQTIIDMDKAYLAIKENFNKKLQTIINLGNPSMKKFFKK